MPYRTRYFDPDYRREPKTNHFCAICQRDLKPGQPNRQMMWELDTMDAVHGEDWETAAVEIAQRRTPRIAWFIGYIGMDCAKRLGFDWSRET